MSLGMAAAVFAPLLLVVAASEATFTAGRDVPLPSFTDFMAAHGRSYQSGTHEYAHRLALFEERVAQVQEQNAASGQLWMAGINKLADRTDEELAQLRGYRRHARPSSVPQEPFGLVGWASGAPDVESLPTEFSWQPHLQAMKNIENQEGCGSCWAFAASTVLRAHAELYQKDRHFSQQQIVSCTPNPQQCGGEGGCKGATIELALDYVARNGCATAEELPYTGSDGTCAASMIGLEGHHGEGGMSFGMTGFQKLPENKLEPLLLALNNQGPVGVSIATGFRWNIYFRGIMHGCGRDAVIDHAVALVGYGQEGKNKYWLIQNSWGPDWGEGGFLRLQRHDHPKEASYCGIDKQPEVGSGCIGGPSEVQVCGTCGILYDAVVPTFELSNAGWWSQHGNRKASMLAWNSTGEKWKNPRRNYLRAHAPRKQ